MIKKGKRYLFLLVGLALLWVGLTVACQTEPPVILKFSSSPAEISTGESAKLSWVVKDATSVSINHGVGVVENVGNKRVSPPATITYTLIATNSGGTVTKSAVVTVSATSTPSPDTTPPVISVVNISGTTQSSVTITWTTNETATSQVEYGLNTSYGSTTPLDTNLVASHSVTLSGLSASTTYHFKVKSKDASGNEATDSDRTFTTLATADTTLPVISAVSTSGVTNSSVTITWTTNEAATSQVEYGLNTSYGSTTPLDTNLVASHSVTLSGLSASTTYHFKVKSKDASGNEIIDTDRTFVTSSVADTTPPVISAVNVSAITYSSAIITLTTNEPARSQVMYGLTTSYGSTAPDNIYWMAYGPVTSLSVTLDSLSAGTAYHFKVKAKDASGNEALSDDYTFTTSQSTNVGGTLSGNVVWNLANSPYTLTSHLLIPGNCVLTIDPGVLVDMYDKFMQVEGTLKVLGTAGQPVTINCRTNTSFPKIVFKPTSIAWNETSQTGSIIQYAVIKGESYGSSLISIENSAPKIVNSTISNANPSSAAISMYQSSSQVVSNNIKGHIGLLVGGGSPTIIGNTIQDCDFSGIQLQSAPTGATLIERNLIKGSETGLIVSISNSRIDIISNTITGNQVGINLSGNNSSISLLTINQNAIYDNTNWNARTWFTDDITMANNWWGTTNSTSIEQKLYDKSDDFRVGSIIYTPFLSTRPASSPLP